jgi:hypothetical protein
MKWSSYVNSVGTWAVKIKWNMRINLPVIRIRMLAHIQAPISMTHFARNIYGYTNIINRGTDSTVTSGGGVKYRERNEPKKIFVRRGIIPPPQKQQN